MIDCIQHVHVHVCALRRSLRNVLCPIPGLQSYMYMIHQLLYLKKYARYPHHVHCKCSCTRTYSEPRIKGKSLVTKQLVQDSINPTTLHVRGTPTQIRC